MLVINTTMTHSELALQHWALKLLWWLSLAAFHT